MSSLLGNFTILCLQVKLSIVDLNKIIEPSRDQFGGGERGR